MPLVASPPRSAPEAQEPPGTPSAFLRWLHGDLRHRVYIAQRLKIQGEEREERWAHHFVSRTDLDYKLWIADSAWGHCDDTYLMIHETRGWRVSDQVNCLKAAVVDLDCHGPNDPPVPVVIEQALNRLRSSGRPLPQLVVHTGRGAQLIWRLKRVGLQRDKTNAAKRWVLLQAAGQRGRPARGQQRRRSGPGHPHPRHPQFKGPGSQLADLQRVRRGDAGVL